jgi:hypothetical protein
MNKKIVFLAVLVLPIALVAGCVNDANAPIGGQRDEHGCLGPAGYSWDEDIGACVREWELDDSQKHAAKTAVDYVGQEYATTITEVTAGECEDCFTVKIEQGTERDVTEVEIINGVAESKILTRHECTESEKQADACTLEYAPVCGFKTDGTTETYGNGCQACADKVVYWETGECSV